MNPLHGSTGSKLPLKTDQLQCISDANFFGSLFQFFIFLFAHEQKETNVVKVLACCSRIGQGRFGKQRSESYWPSSAAPSLRGLRHAVSRRWARNYPARLCFVLVCCPVKGFSSRSKLADLTLSHRWLPGSRRRPRSPPGRSPATQHINPSGRLSCFVFRSLLIVEEVHIYIKKHSCW